MIIYYYLVELFSYKTYAYHIFLHYFCKNNFIEKNITKSTLNELIDGVYKSFSSIRFIIIPYLFNIYSCFIPTCSFFIMYMRNNITICNLFSVYFLLCPLGNLRSQHWECSLGTQASPTTNLYVTPSNQCSKGANHAPYDVPQLRCVGQAIHLAWHVTGFPY